MNTSGSGDLCPAYSEVPEGTSLGVGDMLHQKMCLMTWRVGHCGAYREHSGPVAMLAKEDSGVPPLGNQMIVDRALSPTGNI